MQCNHESNISTWAFIVHGRLKGAEQRGTTHWAEPNVRCETGQCSIVSPAFTDVASLPLLLCSCLVSPSPRSPLCCCTRSLLLLSYNLSSELQIKTVCSSSIFTSAIAPQASLIKVIISASAIRQEYWIKSSWANKYFSASHGTGDLHCWQVTALAACWIEPWGSRLCAVLTCPVLCRSVPWLKT